MARIFLLVGIHYVPLGLQVDKNIGSLPKDHETNPKFTKYLLPKA